MKNNTISLILPNFGGGGAERAYLEIAKELAKRDYFVEKAENDYEHESVTNKK